MATDPLPPNNDERIKEMTRRLKRAFSPEVLEIINESHKHIGHAGAKTGLGHFHLVIKAQAFDNRSRLDAHRMIYQALGEMMKTDIHALSIELQKS